MHLYIPDGCGDAFADHLRTLPDAEAVELAKTAVREGNRKQNTQELFRSKVFLDWLLEVNKRELLGDPITVPERSSKSQYHRRIQRLLREAIAACAKHDNAELDRLLQSLLEEGEKRTNAQEAPDG